MSTASPFWHRITAAAAAGLIAYGALGCKPARPSGGPPKPAPAKPGAAALVAPQPADEYVSVFEEYLPPKGRDPFFPNSERRSPRPVAMVKANKPTVNADLLLKGILGTAKHRLAIINTTFMEIGDLATVHVAGGTVKVHCLEIGEDFAVVQVEGEPQPKRLELNKKGL